MSDAADELPRDTYLTIRAAARRLQMDEAFLRDLIRRGEGPPVARLNSGLASTVSEAALMNWARVSG